MGSATAAETTAAPTIDGVNDLLSGILSNLRFAAKRVGGDDLFKSSLTGIEDQLALLGLEVSNLLDAEAEQYNALCDKYESQEMNLGLMRSTLAKANEAAELHAGQIQEMADGCKQIVQEEQNRAQAAIDVAERNALKWETAYRAQENQVTALRVTTATQLSELKTLRQLEPEKLKKKVYEEKKKTSELTATVKDLQTKYNTASRDVVKLKGHCADIEARNHVLGLDLDEMRERMNLIDGEHCVHGMKFPSPVDERVIFYPHIFMFSLHISVGTANDHDGIRFINNMDFHIMVRNTIGIETTYRISEWGIPLCKIASDLTEHWPVGMDAFVYEFILDQIERTNPLLHARCMWARETLVEDLPLPAKVREVLIADGIDTLALLGSTYAHQLEKLKGIGPDTIGKIQVLCRDQINQWNKEHGTPHVERKNLPTRQKEMDRRVAEITKEKLKELNAKPAA